MVSVRSALLTVCGLAALAGLAAQAQQVYRSVGPDGRVTFSDRPPATGAASPAPTIALPAPTGAAAAPLPFELRNVASRYPVTLYSGRECSPCNSARNFLIGRGIPFSERTVTTSDDVAALRRISGENHLPFLTIGSQQLHGYSEAEWTQFLDAAGYPKVSRLPPTYRNPAPEPLVAVQAPAPAAAQADASQEAPAPARAQLPPRPAPADNPAGIRF